VVEPLRLDYAVNDAEVIAAFKRQQAEIEKERKARGELQKQINDNAAAQRAADKSAAEMSKTLRAEQDKLQASAAKIAESVMTPLARYKKGLAEIVDHLRAGRLTSEEYRAASDKLKQVYQEQSGAAAKLATAERAKNEALQESKKIIDRLLTPQQKYEANIKRINELHAQGLLTTKQHTAALDAEQAALSDIGSGADKSGGLIGGLTTKMAGFVAGLGTASAVIGMLKSEYDALIQRQGKSRDANIDLAAAQSGALDNLDTTLSPEKFAERMRAVSKDLGMSERDLTVAASTALSAKGDKTASEAIDAVVASAKLNRFAPDQLPAMAGSALDLGKHLQMGPEEALGFLMATQRTARTVSLKGVTENIAPGIISGVNTGLSKENAAAVAASISGTAVDPTGAETGTTMSAFFQQLKQFGSKEFGFTGGKEYQQKTAAIKSDYEEKIAAVDAQEMPRADKEKMKQQAKIARDQLLEQAAASLPDFTAEEMLAKLQQDPEARRIFFAKKEHGGFGATFERKMQNAVEQLVTPGTQGFRDYENAIKTQKTLNPQQMYDDTIKAKDAMPAIRLAKQDQQLGNVVNQMQLADTAGAESAIIRSRMAEIRQTMGEGVMKTKLQTVIDDVGSGGLQATTGAISSVDADIAKLKETTEYRKKVGAALGDPALEGRADVKKAQEEDLKSIKVLEEIKTLLKTQAELQQQAVNQQAQQKQAGNMAARAKQKEGNL